MFKFLVSLIKKLLTWVNDKRIDYHFKKEDYHRYKRLMIDGGAREELSAFKEEFLRSSIDYLFLWQKVGILLLTVIIEMTLAIVIACGVFSIQPRPDLNPTTVFIVAAAVVAVSLDFFVVWHLMDKIDTSIYYHRLKKLDKKLAATEAAA